MHRTKSTLLSILLIANLPLAAQVVINEVSASNFSAYPDNFGGYEDWIELYNTTGAPVDISGWYLSDDQSNPTLWPIPAGTIIGANSRQIFFASGKNTSGGGYFHTNFKLNQTSADWTVLADPGGIIVDDFQLSDRCKTNHSRGRTTDGAATWSLFTTPSPGGVNGGASPEYEEKPVFSQPSGFTAGPVSLSLSSPTGADIRYTLDGSDPTAASTLYAAPINIAATTVVRAACFSTTPGVPSSFIETNSYFINDLHTVPVLSVAGDQVDDLLNGNGGLQPVGSFEYFGEDQLLRDKAVGEFNEHGNDSWAYDQRGFDYITRDQFGYNDAIHYPIFRTKSRAKFQRLIIKAAANDNYPSSGGAHIRDAYVHALSQVADLHMDERSYEPCVVYVNGQYWGVYEIREKVDDEDFTDYYYNQDENNLYMLKTWGGTWSEFGGAPAQAEWDALLNYIMTNNMGGATEWAYVDARYNWKSLADYAILNSYVVCTDWLNWNTQWWHGLNPAGNEKKWRYCLWDEDATFGHYINYTGVPDQTPNADPCNPETLGDPGGQGHVPILNKLLAESPVFHDYYINRYIDLSNTVFQCDYMVPFLDSLIALIDPEMTAHCARWGGTYADWQNNVQSLRDFMNQRCAVQTAGQGMVDCYDVTGPHNVVFMVDPPLSGDIQINSIVPGSYPFTGTMYGGITTDLLALPATGWAFGYWEIMNDTIQPSLTDSVAWLTIDVPDTIIAHFVPPVTHDVVVLTDPPNSAQVLLGGTMISSFPHVESVPEGISMPLKVFPNLYFDFLYWEIKHNDIVPADSTLESVDITFYSTDTIIAHLDPEEFGFYAPNSFTPNGDGINDVWSPLGNALLPQTYELHIWDRWGEEIYASTDPLEGWDGTVGGSQAPIGVYVFHTNAIDAISLEKVEYYGHVTLFR